MCPATSGSDELSSVPYNFSECTCEDLKYLVDAGIANNQTDAIEKAVAYMATLERSKKIDVFLHDSRKMERFAAIFVSSGFFLNQYLHTWYYTKLSDQLYSLYFPIPASVSYYASFFLALFVILVLIPVFKKVINFNPYKLGFSLILVFPILELISQIASRSIIKLWLDLAVFIVGFGILLVSQQYGVNIQEKSKNMRILYDEIKDFIKVSISVFTVVIISSGFTFVAFIYGTGYPTITANWALLQYFAFVLVYVAFGFLTGITGQLYLYLINIRHRIDSETISCTQ